MYGSMDVLHMDHGLRKGSYNYVFFEMGKPQPLHPNDAYGLSYNYVSA
jgi:hypothetical protein